ncbi:translation initiation factor eIF2B subunit epsilon-like isoform X2 [Artemia franciscana]|uniref:translation initiation factor eIF2B subunit epsilon-like isoform X2 n=1 Tax=Artemia franciscana TaxID=6661 RepID=UPI0032DB58C2
MVKKEDRDQDKIAVYYSSSDNCTILRNVSYALKFGFNVVYILSSKSKTEKDLLRKQFVKDLGEQLEGKKLIILNEEIYTAADAFKVMDHESVLSTDFIYFEGDILTNTDLNVLMEKHKSVLRKDKDAILTIATISCVPGHPNRTSENEQFLIVDATKKLCGYNQGYQQKYKVNSAVDIDHVKLRFDMINSGVYVCSPKIPPSFVENFDFHSIEDLIKHALMKDEVITNNVYIEEVEGKLTTNPRNHFEDFDTIFEVPKTIRVENFTSESESETDSEYLEDYGDNRDEKAFYKEVFDSLERGYEEKVQSKNLILEISASRYAYNIDTDRLGHHVIKAILVLHSKIAESKDPRGQKEELVKMIKYFSEVLGRYIVEEKMVTQKNCLEAIEVSALVTWLQQETESEEEEE